MPCKSGRLPWFRILLAGSQQTGYVMPEEFSLIPSLPPSLPPLPLCLPLPCLSSFPSPPPLSFSFSLFKQAGNNYAKIRTKP